MKQFYFSIIALLLLTATQVQVQAQEKVMQIHSSGSVVYEIPTAQVDSVTFKAEEMPLMCCDCKEELYYYYRGEKIFLFQECGKLFVKLHKDADEEQFLQLLTSDQLLERDDSWQMYGYVILKACDGGDIPIETLNKYRESPNIISISYLANVGITDEFIVKLKENTTYNQLQNLTAEYNCFIVEENRFVKNQYKISAPKTLLSIHVANFFYKTGLFEFSEPNFVILNAFNFK